MKMKSSPSLRNARGKGFLVTLAKVIWVEKIWEKNLETIFFQKQEC